MDPRIKPRGCSSAPKKKVPPFGGTLFAYEVTSGEVASDLTATLALLTGILALAVRILLLLSGLLAAALLLLAGFLPRIWFRRSFGSLRDHCAAAACTDRGRRNRAEKLLCTSPLS